MGMADAQLRFGDVVVHLDYGLGILEGLEPATDGGEAEVLRLRYADDAVLLVPLADNGLIWRGLWRRRGRYRARPAEGGNWIQRRDRTMEGIGQDRRRMVAALEEAPGAGAAHRPCGRTGSQFRALLRRLSLKSHHGSGRRRRRRRRGISRPGAHGWCLFAAMSVSARPRSPCAPRGRRLLRPAGGHRRAHTVLARQHFDVFKRRFLRHGIEPRSCRASTRRRKREP